MASKSQEEQAVQGAMQTDAEAASRFEGSSRVGLKDWRMSKRASDIVNQPKYDQYTGVGLLKSFNHFHEDDGHGR